MLARIPLQITTIQSGTLKGEARDSATTSSELAALLEELSEVESYTDKSGLRNSGASPLFGLRTDIQILTGTLEPSSIDFSGSTLTPFEQEIIQGYTRDPFIIGGFPRLTQWTSNDVLVQTEKWVGILQPQLERFKAVYSAENENSGSNTSTSWLWDWQEGSVILRVPNIFVGPFNPLICFAPILRPLTNGVGRSVELFERDTARGFDTPNWFNAGPNEPWEIPGAGGWSDVEWSQSWEQHLFREGQSESKEFQFFVHDVVREGLLDGTYSGLRVSLRYSIDDVQRLIEQHRKGNSEDFFFEGPVVQFSNAFSRAPRNSPELEVRSFEQELDRSSAFVLEGNNHVGITFARSSRPNLPPEVEGNPSAEVRALLVAQISLLHKHFDILLNEDSAAPLANIDFDAGRLTAEVQIEPTKLHERIADLLDLTQDFDASNIAEFFDLYELDADGMPNYDSEQFWEFWHSEGNESYRTDKAFVDVLGDLTIYELFNDGSDRARGELKVQWFSVEGGTFDPEQPTSTGRMLGETRLFPRAYDPFGGAVGTLVSEIYPRLTTVGLKRGWSQSEPPQRVNVFLDDRPPQEMANLALRRTMTERNSGLYEDLAWGVVQGTRVGEGAWFIEPSEATLLSHDGRYHHFTFDPDLLPQGTWRFEFVRLNDGARLRQINAVNFSVS